MEGGDTCSNHCTKCVPPWDLRRLVPKFGPENIDDATCALVGPHSTNPSRIVELIIELDEVRSIRATVAQTSGVELVLASTRQISAKAIMGRAGRRRPGDVLEFASKISLRAANPKLRVAVQYCLGSGISWVVPTRTASQPEELDAGAPLGTSEGNHLRECQSLRR